MVEGVIQAELRHVAEQLVQAVHRRGWDAVALVRAVGEGAPDVIAAIPPEGAPVLPPENWQQPHRHAEGWLVVPLAVDDRLLGWFQLAPLPAALDDVLPPLEQFAAGAALALDLALQRVNLQRHCARQQLLNELMRSVSQHLEFDELISTIAMQLGGVFRFERASITLRDGATSHARLLVNDARSDAAYNVSALETLADQGVIAGHHDHVLVADLQGGGTFDAGHDLAALESALRDDGVRSYACLPLSIWGRPIGALCLASSVPGTFEPRDTGFLLHVAGQVAVAVWNALLHEREQKRRETADALARLSQAVNSTLDLARVLDIGLQELRKVIPYDTSSIMLLDDKNLCITACSGFEDPEGLIGVCFDFEEGNITHKVMNSRRVRVVEDVQVLPEWGHDRSDAEGYDRIRAWIGAPLIARDQSIGMLVVDKLEPGFYSTEDGETVFAFASQLALAIHNARLFQALQEQRDKLAAILTDTSDAVIVLDVSRKVWLMNPAAERALHVRAWNVTGQPVAVLGLPALEMAVSEVQANDIPVMHEIATQDGIFNASISQVHGVGWVVVMQNITALKELDRLRTEWVAGVTHDLKNPIQMIQLGAAMIEMDGPLNDLQLERLAIIQRSIDRLQKLVVDVLDLARLEAGPALRVQPVAIAEVVRAALADVEHRAGSKQQDLVLHLPALLPPVNGDAALLQRAIANLLSNAVKYTPDGGTITLALDLGDDELLITVRDTGDGIPPEALPQLFDRFYRVPGTRAEGSGLGLSIVRNIIEKHQGTVRVASTLGAGSTFTIALPVTW